MMTMTMMEKKLTRHNHLHQVLLQPHLNHQALLQAHIMAANRTK